MIGLDVGLRLGFGTFDTVSSGDTSVETEEPARTARLTIGISWYAGAG